MELIDQTSISRPDPKKIPYKIPISQKKEEQHGR
jgi:hypothetical protein